MVSKEFLLVGGDENTLQTHVTNIEKEEIRPVNRIYQQTDRYPTSGIN